MDIHIGLDGEDTLRPRTVAAACFAFTTIFSSAIAAQAAPSTTDSSAQRLIEQNAMLQQLQQAIDTHADMYGGMSVHGPETAVIHLAGMTATLDPNLARLRDRATDLGIRITVSRQQRSLAHLKRIQDTIPGSTPFSRLGHKLVSWGVDPATNTVTVGVTEVTPQLTAAARTIFGDTIRLFHETPLTATAGRLNDTPAFYGGDRIWGPGGAGDYCSFGFTVTDFRNNRIALTAGHCWAMSTPVRHNSYSFGSVSARSVGGGGVDSEFTWYPGLRLAPRMWVGGVSGNLSSLPVHGAGDSCNGCRVYMNGSVTGQKIATLNDVPRCYNVGGNYQCYMQRVVRSATDATPICRPGDSGGPVFAYDGRGGVHAIGIITAVQSNDYGICYYTRITNITAYWGVTVTTG